LGAHAQSTGSTVSVWTIRSSRFGEASTTSLDGGRPDCTSCTTWNTAARKFVTGVKRTLRFSP
jgi:hypothetical protein